MDKVLVYNMQLVMLKKLLDNEMISKTQYELIKNKLIKKHKIDQRLLVK